MKPLAERVALYSVAKPVESTMAEVFQRIIWVLGEERTLLREAILGNRRLPVAKYRRIHAELQRLETDLALVAALRDRHLGLPVAARPAPHAPPRPSGTGVGYGEH